MRLDLFWSLSINSESEAVLCGNLPSRPHRFCLGVGKFSNFKGPFFLDCNLSLLLYGYVLVSLYIIYK